MAFAGAAAIEASLARAAAYGDPVAAIYARMFARHPEMRRLFVNDHRDAVKGEMLARAIETLLDFIGERAYAEHLLRSERSAHDGYGVPAGIFIGFYEDIAGGVREVLGEGWTSEMEVAWAGLVREMEAVTG